MAVTKYIQPATPPDVSKILSDVSAYSLQSKAMLTALGDYWTAYYRNIDPLSTAMSGSVAAISREYTHLLDMVRASNILDIPIADTDQFDLLVFRQEDIETVYDADGKIDHYFIPVANIVDTAYLCTSLFESQVVLKRGEHFDVVHGKGYRLYVDLFGDEGITGYAYELGEESERSILLWAMDIAYTSTIIYERYGRFLYRKAHDSEQYKWMVSALMFFYENAKSTKGIENVLNIMYGVPYTRYHDEVVREIYYVGANLERINDTTEEPYICIETDRAKYYTYAFSDVLYKVGDVVPQFSILASFNKVEDYIDTPKWWEDVAFPQELVAGTETLTVEEKNELMDKVLKYNTVHIKIGVSFDTYRTYLAQVKEFFEIIEGGFPVYLYPLVDSIFKAVFIDKVDMDDTLNDLKIKMQFASQYDWGSLIRYDGQINFYGEPVFDHGYNDATTPLVYNGATKFDSTNYHEMVTSDSPSYNGKRPYFTTFKYHHDNDHEELKITKLGIRSEEKYPWDTSPGLDVFGAAQYNADIDHTGAHTYGEEVVSTEHDKITVAVNYKGFADTVTMRDDGSLDMRTVVRPLEDTWNRRCYDGSFVYNGAVAFRDAADESFTITVVRRS